MPANTLRPTPTWSDTATGTHDSDLEPPRETMLRNAPEELSLPGSRATPLQCMAAPEITPVANVRLRSLGTECVVPLQEDEFPYIIGRHPSFQGYCVRGERDKQAVQLLHEPERPDFLSFVSREHLVLDSFDPSTRQFRVAATRGKNGSYLKAAAMPSHFLLPLATMAKGDWLKLGGTSGDGFWKCVSRRHDLARIQQHGRQRRQAEWGRGGASHGGHAHGRLWWLQRTRLAVGLVAGH